MTRTTWRIPVLMLALAGPWTACSKSPPPTATPEAPPTEAPPAEEADATSAAVTEEVDALVELMSGSFSSRRQAEVDPSYFDIRLHMVPIWRERDDARWLYVEQAVATAPDRPYRQRVYRVSARDDGSIESAVYTMTEPERFVFGWREPAKLQSLRFEDVTRKDGCAVVLRREGDDRFAGATGERSCPSELRGARYATSEVTVSANGVDSWDRGYDAEGAQVWGATEGGYEFRADDPEAPAFEPPPPPAEAGQ